eukprot:CAMPEP_0173315292 /NCGR_PEP_ID=MMETSP1143-20121109/25821_1 /TAXON_ID=483371 /ORGANISM="non described non described, Strain CCMP2298" /LENGTH=106 /DNA_ID=CAMNT_0014258011 /DNA_START=1129 /DNA_END=1446 /DNA_ORIENTATION=+
MFWMRIRPWVQLCSSIESHSVLLRITSNPSSFSVASLFGVVPQVEAGWRAMADLVQNLFTNLLLEVLIGGSVVSVSGALDLAFLPACPGLAFFRLLLAPELGAAAA